MLWPMRSRTVTTLDYLIAQDQQPTPSPFMSLVGECITRNSTLGRRTDIVSRREAAKSA